MVWCCGGVDIAGKVCKVLIQPWSWCWSGVGLALVWCDTAVVGGAQGSSGEQRSGVSSSSRRALVQRTPRRESKRERQLAEVSAPDHQVLVAPQPPILVHRAPKTWFAPTISQTMQQEIHREGR